MKKITCHTSLVEVGDLEKSSFEKLLVETYAASKKVIVVDENTHDLCLEYLLTAFPTLEEAEVILLPVGEENKVMEVCYQVLEALSEYQIVRSDIIITLGGGVVSDMGAFIASIYKRGVDCIHIPTSLLAMVDASLGGKCGINLGQYKNQLGSFHFPKAIFVDYRFLSTLPEEEWVSGFAEIVKHLLIADQKEWEKLIGLPKESIFEEKHVTQMIQHAVKLKSSIVSADPFEKGERKWLNFGHTFGHAIEGFYLELTGMAHGNAVGLGMIAEAYLSFKRNQLTEVELQSIVSFLQVYFSCPEDLLTGTASIFALMQNDKKNDQQGIKTCLLNGIGTCTSGNLISELEVREALNFLYQAYYKN